MRRVPFTVPPAPHGAERRVTHDAMIKCKKNINGMIPHLVRDQRFMGKKGYGASVYAREKKDNLGCKHNHSLLTDLVSLDRGNQRLALIFTTSTADQKALHTFLDDLFYTFFFLNTPIFSNVYIRL